MPKDDIFYVTLEDDIIKQRREYQQEIRLIYLNRICERVIEKCASSLALTEKDIINISEKYKQVKQFIQDGFSAWYIGVENGTSSALGQLETEDELVLLIISRLEKKLINHTYPFDIIK